MVFRGDFAYYVFGSSCTRGTLFSTNPKTTKSKGIPNPATNVVNIIGLTNSDKANITIYDIYGNPIFSRQWEIRKHALSIPVSS
ncbi:hypothetical protein Q2T40_02820 [Winogradskyella maritima]|nr:hypothetical protein [Winogradskyella maritima]